MQTKPQRTLPLFLSATAICFATAAHAEEFDVYGFFNLGILDYDDGGESNSYLVDNSNAPSRIGFNYTVPTETGSVRFNFETALGLVSSSSVDIVDGAGDAFDYDKTSLRKVEVIYDTGTYGTLSFGQGSMATDGAAGADFSGTTLVTTSAISDLAGGNFFRTTGGVLSGITVGSTNDNFDGSRRARLRYDTPSVSGFGASVAYGQEVLRDGDDNDYYDAALNYGADYGDIEAQGYVGYSWIDDDRELLMGSAAFLHKPSGFNGAFATGREDDGGSYYWLKAGIRQDWFAFGQTALSVDYYSGEDFNSDGSDTGSWALAFVQTIDAANLEAFAIYRQYSFEETGTDYQDGDAIMVGGRWKF